MLGWEGSGIIFLLSMGNKVSVMLTAIVLFFLVTFWRCFRILC